MCYNIIILCIYDQTAILVTAGMNYIGASGDINTWNPKVDLPNDFTASQIWLKNGPSEKFESVEAGWAVRSIHYYFI